MEEDPFVQNSLEYLSTSYNDFVANNIYNYLLDKQDPNFFIDDIFKLPSEQVEIKGELKLGKVLGKEQIEFRHLVEKLPMHILAAGTSGSGKTNFSKLLIEQANNVGIRSIKISDPKSEYDDIAYKHPGFLLLKWSDLRFNPLIPPPNVPENEWYQTIVGHMAQCFNFWEGAESLLIKLLNKISKKIEQPTILDLYRALEQESPRYKQKDLLVMGTVSSRLELMLYAFKDVVTTNSTMLKKLHKKHYIVQTTGLISSAESWLLEFLLLWEFMYRVFNSGERELTIHIMDEVQHRLFSRMKEKSVKKISSSVISMLVDQARAYNISIVALSQEPSVLLKSILNNSFMKLSFHLGSGEEVKIMSGGMGLSRDQREAMFYLETGEAIVRMAGGFLEPLPIKIDEFHVPNDVDMNEFRNHQAAMKNRLYEESGIGIDEQEGISGIYSLNGNPQLFNEEYDVLG
ncbi:ATP-binding protein, partial [Caldithrix abyssi]|nr:ATP-binding protein [Caldithrix abyssi]